MRMASLDSSEGALTNSCSSVSTTRFTGFACTRTGFTSASAARSSTDAFSVAENSIVCRPFEQSFRTSRHSFRKPSSRRRSASSKTTISSSSMWTDAVFSRWSSNLPGVAMTMSGCWRSELACSCCTKPPATSSYVTMVYFARSFSMAWHWTASSRVGIRTIAFVATWPATMRPWALRFRARTLALWHRRSRQGSRNDAVLPEPVSAVASTSRPWSAGGITSLWMGVGESNLSSATERSRGLERRRSENAMPVWRLPSTP
mmetsp:Transcript_39347/g.111273  ORF Transcript_39347/g.111273 Transcript_39347/m.111273 type:complete len:260 (+) Transcript_39347:995-1774(+)